MRRTRLLVGLAVLGAGCSGDNQTGPPLSVVTIAPTPTDNGNFQTVIVKTALPHLLRVLVLDFSHNPRPGTAVVWHTEAGALTPATSVTDADGIATTTWTLDSLAGDRQATAALQAFVGSTTFHATAVAGPAASLRKGGDGQVVPVNARFSFDLSAAVIDQYGNSAAGQVTWSVDHGPITIIEGVGVIPIDGSGASTAHVRPTGTQGGGALRAAVVGGGPSATFAVTVGPPAFNVVLRNQVFISRQNNSSRPAVDTIPAGQTVVWFLDPFDYDLHSVGSVGTPSFTTTAEFGFFSDFSTVSVTFGTPGTYHYVDADNPQGSTGIIVVQ